MDDIDYNDVASDYDWLFTGVGLVVWIAVTVVFFIAYIRIIQKAGYSGWWILVGLVPILNVVMFLVFAFATWPVQRENRALRRGESPPYR